MEKIDVNHLLDEEFAGQLIFNVEHRIARRKKRKRMLAVILALGLGISYFSVGQLSRADEKVQYYAYGEEANRNIIDAKSRVYMLENPVKLETEETNFLVTYMYLVDGNLRVRIVPEKPKERVEGITVQVSEQPDYYIGHDSELYGQFKYYENTEEGAEFIISDVTSSRVVFCCGDKVTKVKMVPAEGYPVYQMKEDANALYKGNAVLLNQEEGAFGVHIEGKMNFENWRVRLGENPLSSEPAVWFVGKYGAKYRALPYYDANSFIPEKNVASGDNIQPRALGIQGVMFSKDFEKEESTGFTMKLPKIGEKVEIYRTIEADGIKVRVLSAERLEDNRLRFRVSAATDLGFVDFAMLHVYAGKDVSFCNCSGDNEHYSDNKSFCIFQTDVYMDTAGENVNSFIQVVPMDSEYMNPNMTYFYTDTYVYEEQLKEKNLDEMEVRLGSVDVYVKGPLMINLDSDSDDPDR